MGKNAPSVEKNLQGSHKSETGKKKNGADERWEHHFLISSKNSFLRHNALIFDMLLQFFHRTPSSRFWGNFGVFYHFLGKKWGSVLSANEPSPKPGVKPYSLTIRRRRNIAHLYRPCKSDEDVFHRILTTGHVHLRCFDKSVRKSHDVKCRVSSKIRSSQFFKQPIGTTRIPSFLR